MAKVVIHLLHAGEDSPAAGSHVFEQALARRGVTLQHAKDTSVRFALERATVVTF